MKGSIRETRKLGDDGEWVYVREYLIDGAVVSEREFNKRFPPQPTTRLRGQADWTKPLLCEALAVHPKKVREAIADAQKKGVPVNVLPDGRIEFRSRQQYNAYLDAYGYFNRDAGYGDKADGQTRARDAARFEVNPKDYDW